MRCLSSHAYPGRPLEVWNGEHWLAVKHVLEEMQTPTSKRFHVVCAETNEFWLEYDPLSDCWQVTAVSGGGI